LHHGYLWVFSERVVDDVDESVSSCRIREVIRTEYRSLLHSWPREAVTAEAAKSIRAGFFISVTKVSREFRASWWRLEREEEIRFG